MTINDLDITAERQRQALQSTARFVNKHMADAQALVGREAVLNHALSCIGEGLVCELGVADGHTIRHIASLTSKTVHGFDSFEGLPEAWNGLNKGHFATTLPEVPDNVELHKGWFADVLPVFLNQTTEPLAFLHIDCDLYSSTVTVLKWLHGRIVPGTVIVFDEYFNYPSYEQGEARAWMEFAVDYGIKYEWLCYNGFGEQAALKVTKKGARTYEG